MGEAIIHLYGGDGGLVGQWCPETGRAQIGDMLFAQERTCRMSDTHWDDGECTWGCICSECGAKHQYERGEWMNYCPKCGRRVVE